jgi:hypothetical protein
MGAVLVANMTRPVMSGVSILLIGNWLGLQTSKPDEQAGERERWIFLPRQLSYLNHLMLRFVTI